MNAYTLTSPADITLAAGVVILLFAWKVFA